jgi:hypothetical protein
MAQGNKETIIGHITSVEIRNALSNPEQKKISTSNNTIFNAQ